MKASSKVLLLIFCATSVSLSYAATWTKIDVPGAVETQAYGINSAGDVVGFFRDSENHRGHGFLLKGGTFTTIDVPGSLQTYAQGINDSGIIAGSFESATDFFTRGFVFDGTTFTILDAVPQEDDTVAFGINNAGEVVGYWGCDCSNPDYHGFKWANGTLTTIEVGAPGQTILTAINNKEFITGYNPFTFHSFLRNPNGTARHIGFDDPCCGVIYGLNDAKAMVGFYVATDNGFKVSLPSKFVKEIQFPHTIATFVYGINASGQLVGAFYRKGVNHGFLMTK